MQVDWPINDMLNYLGLLVTGLHKQPVIISKWSFGQVPLYMKLNIKFCFSELVVGFSLTHLAKRTIHW